MEVYLLNAVAGGMMTLHGLGDEIYGYESIRGQAMFAEFNVAKTFMLEPHTSGIEHGFVLRPKGQYNRQIDACLKATDTLSLHRCTDINADIFWTVLDGQIASVRDPSRCLAHRLSNNAGVTQGCSSDARSFVSIVKKESGWTSGGTNDKIFLQRVSVPLSVLF